MQLYIFFVVAIKEPGYTRTFKIKQTEVRVMNAPDKGQMVVSEKPQLLPEEPVSIDIVGKHGQVVLLDPRRVKPFKDNPRLKNSPGFTEDSIGMLAEGLIEVGQQEDVKVVPIIGDPNYDAQLYDGARRHAASIKGGIFVSAKVREDVLADDTDGLYLLSVAANNEKEPHTVDELIRIVARMRDMGKTNREIGVHIGCHDITVSQYFTVSKMHPVVLRMISEVMSFQSAYMLKDFSPDLQSFYAQEIVQKQMTGAKARRFINAGKQRHGVVDPKAKQVNPKRRAGKLANLADESVERFGAFLDMPPKELTRVIGSMSRYDREDVSRQLHFLAGCIKDMADMVAPKN